jgi:type IV pilus assembly protein PilB
MIINPKDKDLRFRQIFGQLDRKFEEEDAQRRAKEFQIGYINLTSFPVDPNVLATIEKSRAEASGAVVFFREGRGVKLGITDPENTQLKKAASELLEQGYVLENYLISKSSLKQMLSAYEKAVYKEKKSSEIKIVPDKVSVTTVKELSHKLANTSATELIDDVMGAALNLESSDVHIEPMGSGVKIRYRIDGVLQDIAVLPNQSLHTIISRIKILSKLKLNVTTVPQDGSFHLTYNGKPVDIRVSVLPSAFGESIVMRILRQDKQNLKFEELGISGIALKKLEKELQKPNGLILTTGPTGSGKTTTLYATLNKLNAPGVKIITLEDPVEYRIPGIVQTPIDAQAGMTFATGLRAILRQDPDIVMVGEMRDLETAEIASQAALTGHIVLSTLHTNDAPSAIPRLIDLGVKPFILAPAINAVIAQRLVRKICTGCRAETQIDASLMGRIEAILSTIPNSSKVVLPKKLAFYHSPGCPACSGLGYKGRIGIYEIFTITDPIENLIHKQAPTSEVRKQAVSDGMLTMSQDGMIKALNGITDVEEVFRVTEG